MEISYKGIKENLRQTVQSVYAKNADLIKKLVSDKTKNEMLEIESELNQFVWDTEKLGDFISDEIATTLFFYLEEVLGEYETLKYWHLVVNKNTPGFCKTEEEFREWILSRLFNERKSSILEGLL